MLSKYIAAQIVLKNLKSENFFDIWVFNEFFKFNDSVERVQGSIILKDDIPFE